MKPRHCEGCGLGMLPWMPRKRDKATGKLICQNCREGRPGRPRAQASRSGDGAHPDALTPTTVEALLAMEEEADRLERAEALLESLHIPFVRTADGTLRALKTEADAAQNRTYIVGNEGEGMNAKFTLLEGPFPSDESEAIDAALARHSGAEAMDGEWVGSLMPLEDRRANLKAEAHDSGDGATIYHCPFCGGGQITGRSDGTAECDYCHQAFTVQVQPQIAAMPQTIDGQPQDLPGMPGSPGGPATAPDTPQDAASPPTAPGDAFVPPGQAPGASDAFVPPQASQPPPPKKKAAVLRRQVLEAKKEAGVRFANGHGYFIGPEGVVMSEQSYIHHLALRFADDRDAVLADIREANAQ